MRGALVFIHCLFCFSFGSPGVAKPAVETQYGIVSGKLLKTLDNLQYSGFVGIPYAKPPLKEFRFLPPQPLEPWEGVLETTKEKPACIQYNYNVRKGSPFGIYGSEDCLYLDVYSPDVTKKHSVLVFLYNEQFRNSYNKTKDYAPDFFIEEKLVVVTISHRLSMFGFLSFEDDVLDGNSGLKDIVAGLKWINKNIHAFGGDPERVTLMGASGGATAVDLLLHSNAKHLFHAAIMQSGSSLSSMYLQENHRERAFRFADALKLSSYSSERSINDLNDVKAEDLLDKEAHALPQDYYKEEQKMLVPFGPVVEKNSGGLINYYPEDSNNPVNIPIMIGSNSGEGIDAGFQYLLEPRYISFVNKDYPFQLPIRVKYKFDPFDELFYAAIDEIKNFYFPKGNSISIKDIPDFLNYLGDVVASYAVDKTARLYANVSSASVYYYNFDYESSLNENKNSMLRVSAYIEAPGAAAGDELCYLFRCPQLLNEYKKDSKQAAIHKKLVRMWANFAKYGNPTPDNNDILLKNIEWAPYTTQNKEYLHIGQELIMKSNLFEERFAFWDNFLEKWSEQAVNGLITKIKNTKDEL